MSHRISVSSKSDLEFSLQAEDFTHGFARIQSGVLIRCAVWGASANARRRSSSQAPHLTQPASMGAGFSSSHKAKLEAELAKRTAELAEMKARVDALEAEKAAKERVSKVVMPDFVSTDLVPAGSQALFGSGLGTAAGYALRVVGKAAAFTIGTSFVGLQTLSYLGYVQVDWRKVERDTTAKLDRDGDGKVTANDLALVWREVESVLIFNCPAGHGLYRGAAVRDWHVGDAGGRHGGACRARSAHYPAARRHWRSHRNRRPRGRRSGEAQVRPRGRRPEAQQQHGGGAGGTSAIVTCLRTGIRPQRFLHASRLTLVQNLLITPNSTVDSTLKTEDTEGRLSSRLHRPLRMQCFHPRHSAQRLRPVRGHCARPRAAPQ